MGREIRRVPLDFDWPLNTVWEGFLTPDRPGPPAGDGWQVWETVSEGSPISPVCASRDTLIAWLVTQGYSPLAAERFVDGGYAPSALIVNGTMYRDIEGCAMLPPKADGR